MKVLKPVTFDPSTMLISSNAVEAHALWLVGTTYAKGNRVRYELEVYESLINSNVGVIPTSDATKWLLIGPTNTHAMFDQQASTSTTSATPLIVEVLTGTINSVSFVGLVGGTLQVQAYDGAPSPRVLTYDQTFDLEISEVYDWYEYFFADFSQLTQVTILDIPPYSGTEIKMTLSAESGTVSIAEMLFGTSHDLGSLEKGVSTGIIDYSRKDTDEFGVATFVPRGFSDRMTGRFLLENGQLRRVRKLLASLRSTPAVWVGVESDMETYEPLVVYGFMRDFTIEIPYDTHSLCSIELEGLASE